MIRINLLPHREEKRRARRQQFYAVLALITVLSGLIVFLVYSVIGGYIAAQDAKNDFLQKEIAVLNKQIDQINRLKAQSDALMARKRIIESLQRDRAEAVRLLSELAKQMPEGVYIRSLKQVGQSIHLSTRFMIMAFSAPVGRLPGRRTALTRAPEWASNTNKQVTVVAVVVIVERQGLLAIGGIVGVIQIQRDRARRFGVASDELRSRREKVAPLASACSASSGARPAASLNSGS
jgi:Tfp pilus assembly protein PilN